MFRPFAFFVLSLLCLTPLACAEDGFSPFPADCDTILTDTVVFAETEIQVRTSFTAAGPGAADVWPVIRQTAIYRNGDVLIDRQIGFKLIDDEVPCDMWYEEAHHQLVRTLANAHRISESRGVSGNTELAEARKCLEDLEVCASGSEAWRFPDTLKSMTLAQFERLLSEDPRIFYIKETAYSGQTVLFDMTRRRLVPILEGGC